MENNINIGTLIKELLQGQNKIISVLEDNRIDAKYDDSIILEYLSKVSVDSLYFNSAIAKKVADYCQLLNEKRNFEEVSLEKIEEIYRVLIKVNPLDIGFYESLAFYLNNVQDRPEEARLILNLGISIVEKRISDLKKATKEIR